MAKISGLTAFFFMQPPDKLCEICIAKQDFMKAATERKIIRWIHLLGSIPILGLIYGPVGQIPNAVLAIQRVLMPMIIISGLWLWKGHHIRKRFRKIK